MKDATLLLDQLNRADTAAGSFFSFIKTTTTTVNGQDHQSRPCERGIMQKA